MNRLTTVVLIAITAAVTLPSMGCFRRDRRPAREVVVVHEHNRRR